MRGSFEPVVVGERAMLTMLSGAIAIPANLLHNKCLP